MAKIEPVTVTVLAVSHIGMVLELVIFKIKPGVTRERLLETAEAVTRWARAQPGFVSRELSYAKEGDRWIEVVYWAGLGDAQAATKAAETSEQCAPMFALIEMESMDFMHGIPVGRWT